MSVSVITPSGAGLYHQSRAHTHTHVELAALLRKSSLPFPERDNLPMTPPPDLRPESSHSTSHSTSSSLSSSSSPGSRALETHLVKNNGIPTPRRNNKRPASPAHDQPAQAGMGREPQKKKKATRACYHCQRAHLTCDDARPCQRCVKRGIADNCTEGHRKKAKYLLDDDELEALKHKKKLETVAVNDTDVQSTDAFPHEDALQHLSFDTSYSFGSEAANLEYSILSAMLGNPVDDPALDSQLGSLTPRQQPSFLPTSDPSMLASSAWGAPTPTPSSGSAQGFGSQRDSTSMYSSPYSSDMSMFGRNTSPSLGQSMHPYAGPQSFPGRATTSYLRTASVRPTQMGLAPPSPPTSNPSPGSPAEPSSALSSRRSSRVYSSVDRPYDYTQGYHFLMQHLHDRFDKNDILRIVRALAIFRPSLIALQMPLSEEDEVFVEKCFQRSLLELEKLISFSGTPTVVWRRTGEICVVGLEFTMLTDWTRQDLLGNRKFIYELFENQSVVEYWEAFAKHAFENATQSVYSHCVLLKPSGVPVPCAFCFSIRRDIFDLPSIVIGQWLPLL